MLSDSPQVIEEKQCGKIKESRPLKNRTKRKDKQPTSTSDSERLTRVNGKLTNFIRLTVYAYIDSKCLFTELSRMSRRERINLEDSLLAGKRKIELDLRQSIASHRRRIILTEF